MRKILVIFQFTLSILLIIGTLVVHQQIDYIRSKDLGFNQEQLVQLPLFQSSGRSLNSSYRLVKQEFLKHPLILAASASLYQAATTTDHGLVRPEGSQDFEYRLLKMVVDEDFLDTYGINLIEGRNFSVDIVGDAKEAFLINESAAKLFGWKNPVGKRFDWYNRRGYVIGVVKDFHNRSLHEPIAPAFLLMWESSWDWLTLRIRPENLSETMMFLEKTWKTFVPDRTFEYTFLDKHLEGLYLADRQFGRLVDLFTSLAILIACLGLLGLAAFTAEQRTKELGVRKVLGASTASLVLLLSMDLLKLVAMANLLAWPLGYVATDQWLTNFAYRVEVGWETYLVGGCLALVVALSTVSYQALKAAHANPVEALRNE